MFPTKFYILCSKLNYKDYMAKINIKSEKITPFGGIFHERGHFLRFYWYNAWTYKQKQEETNPLLPAFLFLLMSGFELFAYPRTGGICIRLTVAVAGAAIAVSYFEFFFLGTDTAVKHTKSINLDCLALGSRINLFHLIVVYLILFIQ